MWLLIIGLIVGVNVGFLIMMLMKSRSMQDARAEELMMSASGEYAAMHHAS